MKSKSSIIAAVVFICGIAGGLVYANMDGLDSALARANEHMHGTQGAVAASREGDAFGCHRHGPVTYHCH